MRVARSGVYVVHGKAPDFYGLWRFRGYRVARCNVLRTGETAAMNQRVPKLRDMVDLLNALNVFSFSFVGEATEIDEFAHDIQYVGKAHSANYRLTNHLRNAGKHVKQHMNHSLNADIMDNQVTKSESERFLAFGNFAKRIRNRVRHRVISVCDPLGIFAPLASLRKTIDPLPEVPEIANRASPKYRSAVRLLRETG